MSDWAAIKSKYVTGDYDNLKDLSEQEGLNYGTVRKHAAGWEAEKEAFRNRVRTASEQKSVEKIADTESEIAAIKSRVRLKWWKRLERVIDSLTEEETADGRNSGDARKELQNFVDLMSIEPEDETGEAEDTDSYFGEAGLDE